MNTGTGRPLDSGASVDHWADLLGRALGDEVVIRSSSTCRDAELLRHVSWWRFASRYGQDDETVWVGANPADIELLLGNKDRGSDAGKDAFGEFLTSAFVRTGAMVTHAPDHKGFGLLGIRFSDGEEARLLIAIGSAVSPVNSNLEFLMEIELPVMLRFGATEMAMREVVGLKPGSMIEFDQSLNDPIDVLVNGHIVARGEVVTVEGAYGVRISEIASKKARLDSSALTSRILHAPSLTPPVEAR